MLLKRSAIFWLAFSLTGCVGGPQVSPCVLDPTNGVAYCALASGGDKTISIKEMDNYTAFSPDDMQALAEWIKRHKACAGGIKP